MRTGEVKEIRLKGLSSAVNDYECDDGELQVCHNAVNTGAGLRPIREPETLRTLPAGWTGLVFVHHTTGGDIDIVVDGDNNALWYKGDGEGVMITEPQTGLFTADGYQVTSVGNVMIVNFKDSGLHYYRWKEDERAYKYLGQAPPDVGLEFSCVHYNGKVEDDGTISYENGYIMQTDNKNQTIKFTADLQFTQGSMLSYAERFEDYPDWLDFMLGRVNTIKGEMRRQGLFLGKFFVRTAYRLYDGTYIMQSAPVLIAPSMEENPMIWPYKITPSLKTEETGSYWEISVDSKILYRPFVLVAKSLISDVDAERLKDWQDVIDRVCVFVTPEMQSYTEEPRHMVLTRKQKIPQYGTEDASHINGVPVSTLADPSKGETWKEGAFRSYTAEALTFGEIVRKMYSPPRIEDGGIYELPEGNDADDQYSKAMVQDEQHFGLGVMGDVSYSAELYHHQHIDYEARLTTDEETMARDEAMLTEFGGYHHIVKFEQKPGTEQEQVEQQYLFYPLKEYTIDEAVALGKETDTENKTMEWPWLEINQSSAMWPRRGETVNAPADASFVKFPKNTLETLTSRTDTLKDDYNSWQNIMPDVMHTYNGRLNVAGVTIGFRDVPCTWLGGQALKGDYDIQGQVVIITNGVTTKAPMPEYLNYNLLVNMGFFYYPHPDAKKIQILAVPYGASGQCYLYEFKLKTHPFMHGAYFFEDEFNVEDYRTGYDTEEEALAAMDEAGGVVEQPNYMYTSEVENPFFFPAEGVNAIGTGRIIAIKSATKAMSEGTAYGAMPLYAFCTDGVWPLSVGTTGLFVATNPPTRETLVNNDPNAALQIDDSVIFMTERGIIELVGQRTTLLSGALQERFSNLDVRDLEKWQEIMEVFGSAGSSERTGNVGEFLQADDFLGFIGKGARMAFDYVNYRIIVFRPYDNDDTSTHTAYIYDIWSKMWATMDNRLLSSVEGYPASLVNVVGDNAVMVGKFSQDSTALVGGGKMFYATRPMKLGKHDVLKTLRTLIERSISDDKLKYLAVWGSRDMKRWNIISAVNGGTIPRLSGTPYKYFVVAGWSKLDVNGDVISRLTIEERDKYLDKLR